MTQRCFWQADRLGWLEPLGSRKGKGLHALLPAAQRARSKLPMFAWILLGRSSPMTTAFAPLAHGHCRRRRCRAYHKCRALRGARAKARLSPQPFLPLLPSPQPSTLYDRQMRGHPCNVCQTGVRQTCRCADVTINFRRSLCWLKISVSR